MLSPGDANLLVRAMCVCVYVCVCVCVCVSEVQLGVRCMYYGLVCRELFWY